MALFDKYNLTLDKLDPIKFTGAVTKVQGLLAESHGPQVVVGELCQIGLPKAGRSVWAEVVGVRQSTAQLMPYSDMEGIDKILLRDLIGRLAGISDRAENVGDRIRIMVAKRSI